MLQEFDKIMFWREEQHEFFKQFPELKPKGKGSLNYWINKQL